MEKLERINKFLSEAGVCSRREVDELIETGRVEVNGQPARIGMQIDTERDHVLVDGELVDPDHPWANAISLKALQEQAEREPWWVEHNQQKAEREASAKLNPKSRLLRSGKKSAVGHKSGKTGKNLTPTQQESLRRKMASGNMHAVGNARTTPQDTVGQGKTPKAKTFSEYFANDKQALMNVRSRRVEGVNPKSGAKRSSSQATSRKPGRKSNGPKRGR